MIQQKYKALQHRSHKTDQYIFQIRDRDTIKCSFSRNYEAPPTVLKRYYFIDNIVAVWPEPNHFGPGPTQVCCV